jgi:HSP20 family protein
VLTTKKLLALTHFISDRQWSGSSWCPSADVYRYHHGWLVKCELAGLEEQDIQLSVKGHDLFIKGSRRDLLVKQGHQSYSMEIAYNRFERVVKIPADIEQAKITTIYQNGMLLIYLE